MSSVPRRLRRLVVVRAGERCEYCRLAQIGQEATFHIDHILPVVDGGETAAANLALACVSCSLRKEARQTVRDPDTDRYLPIFNPRTDRWSDHFRWEGAVVIGLTAKARGTIELLRLNRPRILAIRREEMARGRHPPLD
jgi:HNH endonuclease